MSIHDEFKKMTESTTNPIESLNEKWIMGVDGKEYRVAEETPIQDAEVVEGPPGLLSDEEFNAATGQGVKVPASLTGEGYKKLKDVFNRAGGTVQTQFVNALLHSYATSGKKEEFKNLLRRYGF